MKKVFIICLLAISILRLYAQQPGLLTKVEKHEAKGYVSLFNNVVLDSIALFSGLTANLGEELWRTDGTAAGTFLVKDINPGSNRSYPSYNDFAEYNNKVYFSADDGIHGSEIWVTDGTESGTMLFKDINVGPIGSSPSNYVNVNEKILFLANDSTHGGELWVSDGTDEGTHMVKDIFPGTEGSYSGPLISNGTIAFFGADDKIHGSELWKSDGTPEGTMMVKDIVPGEQDGLYFLNESVFKIVDSLVFFRADDRDSRMELWRSNGTEAGTYLVKDIIEGSESSYPQSIFGFNGKAYVMVDDGIHGEELWVSDGNGENTRLLMDIRVGPESSEISDLYIHDSILFFTADDSVHGRELWAYHESMERPELVKDIYVGKQGSCSWPYSFVSNGSSFYFTAADADQGKQIWKLQYPNGDPQMVSTLDFGEYDYDFFFLVDTIMENLLIYASTYSKGSGLWLFDESINKLELINEFYHPGIVPSAITKYGNSLFINGPPLMRENKLYYYNKTNSMLRSLGESNNKPVSFNGLLFTDISGFDGSELYSIDDQGNKQLIKDIYPGIYSSGPSKFTATSQHLYFIANDGEHGRELWRSDGTNEGTILFKDFRPGDRDYRFTDMLGLRKNFFIALDQGSANNLWVTDGTEEGTEIIREYYYSHGGESFIPHLFPLDTTILFCSDGEKGAELWISDGTVDGTVLLHDIAEGELDSWPSSFTRFGDYVVFTANDHVHGNEIWKLDLNTYSLIMLKDVNPGLVGSYPRNLTAGVDGVYFTANDSEHGYELWKTDGTKSGTVMVSDIFEGPQNSLPDHLCLYKDKMYFAATDATNGRELWYTDGTEENTKLSKDINSGHLSSTPYLLTTLSDTMFFCAYDEINGSQIWYMSANPSRIELKPLNQKPEFIHIYPNPNKGDFTIRFSEMKFDKAILLIHNSNGKIVFSVPLINIQNKSDQQFSLSKELVPGPYVITVVGESNIFSKKIVVK